MDMISWKINFNLIRKMQNGTRQKNDDCSGLCDRKSMQGQAEAVRTCTVSSESQKQKFSDSKAEKDGRKDGLLWSNNLEELQLMKEDAEDHDEWRKTSVTDPSHEGYTV